MADAVEWFAMDCTSCIPVAKFFCIILLFGGGGGYCHWTMFTLYYWRDICLTPFMSSSLTSRFYIVQFVMCSNFMHTSLDRYCIDEPALKILNFQGENSFYQSCSWPGFPFHEASLSFYHSRLSPWNIFNVDWHSLFLWFTLTLDICLSNAKFACCSTVSGFFVTINLKFMPIAARILICDTVEPALPWIVESSLY
jgi:hypothetical protein